MKARQSAAREKGLKIMEDLFRSYWWLLFPLSWFIISGWQSWLNYRRHRDTLDIVKDYAKSGKDIPAGLLDKLNAPRDYDEWTGEPRSTTREERREYRRRYGYGGWSRVVLFGVLMLGFLYAWSTDAYSQGSAFLIVAFVMAALALSSLVATLTYRRRD